MEGLKSSAPLQTGRPWPLGAHWDGQGVNFAVYSSNAQAMTLCLFDDVDTNETARYPLPAHTGDIWHGYLPAAGPGLIYGLRAHGLWRPDRGHLFNASKLLLDPYARDIVGTFEWRDEHFGSDRHLRLHPDSHDNALHALKARVVDDRFDWEGDTSPQIPLDRTVLYEVHVRGYSRLNDKVPPALRGSYAGLAN